MLSADSYGTSLGEWSNVGSNPMGIQPVGVGGSRQSPYGRTPFGASPQRSPAAPQQRASRPAGQRASNYSAYSPGNAQPVQQPSQGNPYAPQRQPRPSGAIAWDHPSNPRGPNYDPNVPMPDDTPDPGEWRGSGQYYSDSGSPMPGYPQYPRPVPSQGNPYGGPRPEGRYAAGTSQEYMAANPDTGPFGGDSPRPAFQQPPTFTPGEGPGNFAYAPPSQRPQPFTQSMNFMGQQMDPGQFYGQRDAFIQNINEARRPFAMSPAAGRPAMDFGGMWGQAGDMAQNGWRSPLAGLMQKGR